MLKYLTLQDPGIPEFTAILLALVGIVLIGYTSPIAAWGAVALWFAFVITIRSQIESATKAR